MLQNISMDDAIYKLLGLVLFIFAGSVHEFAHAFTSYVLGDTTAKNNNRLTLNPLAHIHIIGSILFPLIGMFSGLPIFGWMKPVPTNPNNFKNPSRDSAITAAAGPFSNLLQATIALILLKAAMLLFSSINIFNTAFQYIFEYGILYININLILMIFNLLPMPPLDGGWIIRHFLPDNLKARFELIYPFSSLLLIIILVTDLLKFIFMPAQLLMQVIINSIIDTNIMIFFIPLIIEVVIITLLLKNDIQAFIKRSKYKVDIKKKEIEHKIKLAQTKISNATHQEISKKIVKKLEENKKLNKEEIKKVEELESLQKEEAKLCDEIDFEINDEHCLSCESFFNCILRKIRSFNFAGQ